MRNCTRVLRRACGVTALLMMAATAEAQTIQPWTDRGFVNFSVGVQPGSKTHNIAGSIDIYDEVATFGAPLRTSGSATIDLMGGARVWKNLAVGLGFSTYSDSVGTEVSARIPDPLFFDSPHDSSQLMDRFEHKEKAVHLSAAYMLPMVLPVVDMIEVMVYGGPSFFSLGKDVIGGILVHPGDVTIGDVFVERQSGRGTGAHFGVDIRYPLTRTLAAGLFIRRATASIDMEQIEGGKIDVGGASYGVGIRYRF